MNFRQFLEDSRGMRAKISEKPNVYEPGYTKAWVDMVLGLAGKWVDIDTQNVFGTDLNAIHPETGGIFHLPLKHVQDIENDIRPMMAKCGWCGATFRDVPDKHIGEECPKCNAWPEKDSAVIDRLKPLVTVKNGKTQIINYGQQKVKTPEGDVYR